MQKTTDRPRLTDNAKYAAAQTKLFELRKIATDAEREAGDLENRILRLCEAGGRTSLITEAQAMISGLPVETINPEQVSILLDQRAKLLHRAGVAKEAQKIHEQEVLRLRRVASQQIIDRLRPEYGKILRRLALAVTEVARAARGESQFRADLEAEDVVLGNLTVLPFEPAYTDDAYSAANRWLREAIKAGAVKRSEIEWKVEEL